MQLLKINVENEVKHTQQYFLVLSSATCNLNFRILWNMSCKLGINIHLKNFVLYSCIFITLEKRKSYSTAFCRFEGLQN